MKNWASAELEDLCELVRGVSFPTDAKHHEAGANLVACLRTANVQKAVDWDDLWFINESHVKNESQWLRKNDVLISNANSYELVGKVAQITQLPIKATLGTFISALRPREEIHPDYFFWLMSADATQKSIRALASTTTNISNVSGAKLKSLQFRLAPYAEQTRIVTKLEELLSALDAGVAELKAAQKKLRQYRQSLLKAAVSGELTAAWRKKNPPKETGQQLFQRILRERRSRWEATQLAKFQAQGKAPPKGWKEKYVEPAQADLSGLPQLPEGWAWASLDSVGLIASGVAKGSKQKIDVVLREVPYLRVANVQRGYLDLSEVKTILATEQDISDLALIPGDVLFNEGGDRDKLGRGWVWYGQVAECIHQNHVFRWRALDSVIQPELISHHGNTFGKRWFETAGKQTTNLASINLGILKMFPVPVAPICEQAEILSRVQSQLEAMTEQEKILNIALKQSTAQRKNILQAAFSGQLVPQDPADEPASALLARIRAARGALTAVKPKSARGRKAKGL